jgi:hypothetical protein
MKNNKDLNFAYLDADNKPILTENHTGNKIDDLTKDQLIAKIRFIEEHLEGVREASDDLRNVAVEPDASWEYVIEELESINEATSFILANLRRTNV